MWTFRTISKSQAVNDPRRSNVPMFLKTLKNTSWVKLLRSFGRDAPPGEVMDELEMEKLVQALEARLDVDARLDSRRERGDLVVPGAGRLRLVGLSGSHRLHAARGARMPLLSSGVRPRAPERRRARRVSGPWDTVPGV